VQNAVAKSDWDIALELPALQAPLAPDDAPAPKTIN
jgi:hypothetical protein